VLFAKWPNSLISADDPIVLAAITDEVDFEAELGVVVGAGGLMCVK
jgi:acylpyruvate hydrolase